LLAISRCFSADIEAKPRRALRISNTVTSHRSKVRHYLPPPISESRASSTE
jgi:hypothetical protein